MKNKTFLGTLILLAAFVALAFGKFDSGTFQKNCKNPKWEKPFGNPLHLYEFVYREESDDIKENAKVKIIVKHTFDKNGNIIETQSNRHKSLEEREALGEDLYAFTLLQLVAKPKFDKEGRITSVLFFAKDTIPIKEMKYAYPKEGEMEVEYINYIYEDRYQKNKVKIKDCRAIEEKAYDKNGRLQAEIKYVSDLVTNATIHFKNGMTQERVENHEIIKKDSKGNWIEKTVKVDQFYTRIFRHYAYEKPTVNYSTPEDFVNVFLEAFQSGNFETLKKKGIAGKTEYMEMFTNSENHEPYGIVRKLGLKGDDFFKNKLIAKFINFRSRNKLDWKNITVENLKIEILKEGIYNTHNKGARISFNFSDGNKMENYSFPLVHLSSGWHYIKIK